MTGARSALSRDARGCGRGRGRAHARAHEHVHDHVPPPPLPPSHPLHLLEMSVSISRLN